MDETEHWRQRLLELKDALDAKQAAMAARIGVDASYFSRLLYEPGKKGRKNLGLDTLRSLIKAYQLSADWFDLPLGTALPDPERTAQAEASDTRFNVIDRVPEHNVSDIQAGELARAPIAWPFKDVAYRRLIDLQAALGPQQAAEAMRDLDSLLDIAVARWEHRAAQLSKRAG